MSHPNPSSHVAILATSLELSQALPNFGGSSSCQAEYLRLVARAFDAHRILRLTAWPECRDHLAQIAGLLLKVRLDVKCWQYTLCANDAQPLEVVLLYNPQHIRLYWQTTSIPDALRAVGWCWELQPDGVIVCQKNTQ